jgi:hypothetical protein
MAHRIWSVWCRALKCLIHYTLVKGFSVVFPPIAIYCLLVFSYFFFVSVQFLYCSCARAAADMGSPIATLNIGPTRADDLALFKVSARSGEGSAHSRLLHVFEWFLKHGFCLLVRNSYAVMYFRYCLDMGSVNEPSLWYAVIIFIKLWEWLTDGLTKEPAKMEKRKTVGSSETLDWCFVTLGCIFTENSNVLIAHAWLRSYTRSDYGCSLILLCTRSVIVRDSRFGYKVVMW